MYKYAKNHANWFRSFEDVGSHSGPVFWPALQMRVIRKVSTHLV